MVAQGGYRPWVELSLAVACTCLLVAASLIGPGPQIDLLEARALSWQAAAVVRTAAFYADAGYDAEWLRGFWRNGAGTRTVIPPVARGGYGVIKTPRRRCSKAVVVRPIT